MVSCTREKKITRHAEVSNGKSSKKDYVSEHRKTEDFF